MLALVCVVGEGPCAGWFSDVLLCRAASRWTSRCRARRGGLRGVDLFVCSLWGVVEGWASFSWEGVRLCSCGHVRFSHE
jgi:hypothetical protein